MKIFVIQHYKLVCQTPQNNIGTIGLQSHMNIGTFVRQSHKNIGTIGKEIPLTGFGPMRGIVVFLLVEQTCLIWQSALCRC